MSQEQFRLKKVKLQQNIDVQEEFVRRSLLKEMSNQCYYCEQMFDSKEKLFDHVEVHAKLIPKLSKRDVIQAKKKTVKKKDIKFIRGNRGIAKTKKLKTKRKKK